MEITKKGLFQSNIQGKMSLAKKRIIIYQINYLIIFHK